MDDRNKDESIQIGELSVSKAKWILPKQCPENIKDLFKQKFGLSDLISYILANRNFKIDDLSNYLKPKIKNLMPNPSELIDMDKAVDRLYSAVINKETIGIFGDYDVDGACSAAIVSSFLTSLGCNIEIHIPDRFTEGYGPNTEALKQLEKKGCGLILTVDCGITAHEPLKEAYENGIDIIVVDHHITGPSLPKAFAIINPNRFDQKTDLTYLSAAGVCFITMVGLNRFLNEKKFFEDTSSPDLRKFLDLVALATVCDVVPLKNLNRAFVSLGLKVMSFRGNFGLKALFDSANIDESPNEQNLGFSLGPRINAAGRLGESKLGVELLCSKDEVQADILAQQLNDLNNKRREIQNIVLDEVIEKIEKEKLYERKLIIVYKKGWHEGVLGIVAGKIKDTYHKPAIIISVNDKNIGKGSCRSIPGIDMGTIVISAHQNEILLSGGGHSMAAGLTIPENKISDFYNFFELKLKNLNSYKATREYLIELIINVGAANRSFLEEVKLMAPFGSHNSEPIIVMKSISIQGLRKIGKDGRHLAFNIKDSIGDRVDGVAFNVSGTSLGEAINIASNGPLLNVLGYLRENKFNNRPQFHLKDCILLN